MKDSRRCNSCVVFVGERKKSTCLQLLSVASNLLIHMCDSSLQLQIPLSQTLSCFAPNLPSYLSHCFSSRTKCTVLKYWDDFARTISQYHLKGCIRTDSGY